MWKRTWDICSFSSWGPDSKSNRAVHVPVPWLVTGLEESESWCLFWLCIFLMLPWQWAWDSLSLLSVTSLPSRLKFLSLHWNSFFPPAYSVSSWDRFKRRNNLGFSRAAHAVSNVLSFSVCSCIYRARFFNTRIGYSCLITLSACTVNDYFTFGLKLSLFSAG